MTEETSEKVRNPDKPSRSRDKSHKWEKTKVLKKVVIRRLPPSMNEETFLEQIEPLPDHENYYFVPADWSLGHDSTARAYINFVNQEDIFLFKDRFDGYVFVDNKGAEYPAVVEFAAFQGLPRNKSRKKDPKASSIESDPHYLNFLENMNKEEADGSKGDSKLEYSYQPKDDKKITSTPLLQYLANKKQERRDERKRKMDEKRRQRDEERQRKKNQTSNNMPQSIAEEDAKDDDKPKEKSSDRKRDRDKTSDDRKESRNRRRDQKRKEERERNQLKSQESRADTATADKSSNRARDEIERKNKEPKKYSLSRREKQRARDENRRAEAASNADRSSSQPSTPGNLHTILLSDKLSSGNTEISDSVKEFIKSVASCKEFVPQRREVFTVSALEGNKSVDTESGLAEVRNKLEQLSTSEKSHGESSKEAKPQRSGSERAKDEKITRRIRNKDRPSLEIYQPRKMRLPGNKDESGRSSCEPRDYKSNPTSDCESVKREKEDKTNSKKKVSRYSERRSDRAKRRLSKEREGKGEHEVDGNDVGSEDKPDEATNDL